MRTAGRGSVARLRVAFQCPNCNNTAMIAQAICDPRAIARKGDLSMGTLVDGLRG